MDKYVDKKYTLYDYYEGEVEILDTCVRTPNNAYDIAYQRIVDTDGECDICFRPTTPESVDPILEEEIWAAIVTAYDDYETELAEREMINSLGNY